MALRITNVRSTAKVGLSSLTLTTGDISNRQNAQLPCICVMSKCAGEEQDTNLKDCGISNDFKCHVTDVSKDTLGIGSTSRKRERQDTVDDMENRTSNSPVPAHGNSLFKEPFKQQENHINHEESQHETEGKKVKLPESFKTSAESGDMIIEADDISLEKIVEEARSLGAFEGEEGNDVHMETVEVAGEESCKAEGGPEKEEGAGEAAADGESGEIDLEKGHEELKPESERQGKGLINSNILNADDEGGDQEELCEREERLNISEAKSAGDSFQLASHEVANPESDWLSNILASCARNCRIHHQLWNAYACLAIGKDNVPAILNSRPTEILKSSKAKILEMAQRTRLIKQDKAAILVPNSILFAILRVAICVDRCQAQGFLVGHETTNGRIEVTGISVVEESEWQSLKYFTKNVCKKNVVCYHGAFSCRVHERVVGIFRCGEDGSQKFPGACELEFQNKVDSESALLGLICTVSKSQNPKSLSGISRITFVGYQACGQRKTWSIVEQPFCPMSARNEDCVVDALHGSLDWRNLHQAQQNLKIQQAYMKAKLNVLRSKCTPIFPQPRNTLPFAMTFNLIKISEPSKLAASVLPECQKQTEVEKEEPNAKKEESSTDTTLPVVSTQPHVDTESAEICEPPERKIAPGSFENEAVRCVGDAQQPALLATSTPIESSERSRWARRVFASGQYRAGSAYAGDKDLFFPQDPSAELFPPRSLDPKVTASVKVPLKVEVDRRRKLFVNQDISKILETEGVTRERLSEAVHDQDFISISVFDDKDLEPRTWEEWTEIGSINSRFHFLPARAFHAAAGIWRPCKVIERISENDTYKFRWADTDEIEVLPRLLVMFLAEDPFMFARRVARALKIRDSNIKELMYNFFVDNMPTEGVPNLSLEQLNRVMMLVSNSGKIDRKSLDAIGLVEEMNLEYSRTMNRITLDAQYDVDNSNEMMRNVYVPPLSFHSSREYGVLQDIPPHDWAQQYCLFNFNSFLTKTELINCIVKTKTENQKILSMSLFAPHPNKTTKPDEFEHLELQAISQTSAYLKDTWLTSLKNSLRNGLKDVGKGWFNLNETKREVYDISKLKKFMTMINFMMQDTLRSMAEDSLTSFADFICSAVAYEVEVHDISTVKNHRLVDSHLKWPLFKLELILNQDGTVDIGSNGVPTPFEQVVEMPLSLFDKALASISDIPQIEPMVVDQIFWSSKPILASIHPTENLPSTLRERMKNGLEESLKPMQEYTRKFDEFRSILTMKPEEYVAEFMKDASSSEVLKKKLTSLVDSKADIEHRVPLSMQIGAFELSLESLRVALQSDYQKMIDLFLHQVAAQTKELCDEHMRKCDQIVKKLKNPAKNIEELTELKEFIHHLPESINSMNQEIARTLQNYELLDEYKYEYARDDTKRRWNTYGILSKISQAMEFANSMIKSDKEVFESEMMEAQEEFANELSSISALVVNFSKHSDLAKTKEISESVVSINQKLKDAMLQAQLFNSREAQLERAITNYNEPPFELQKVQKAFEPYSNFWMAAREWESNFSSWMDGKFNEIDPEQVDRVTQNSFRVILKSIKFFEGKLPELLDSAHNLKTQIDSFKELIPLVQALRQPGMRDRHWQNLTELLGFDLKPDDTFTLRVGIEKQKLHERMETIVKVCDIAGKEFAIEEALNKMERDWKGVELHVKAYRDTGTFVLGGWDEIFQLLDDHIVLTQGMTFSPYKKPFEERISKWEHALKLCSDILEQLLACQRNWMYLEPIFASDDIQKQLPTESKRFQTVDRNWRKFTAEANKNSEPLQLCNTERILHTFVDCNKLLDMVAKGLSDYLETKRSGFARFYFLSNDELLEILSQTRDPLAVQPHLRKCFEAIDRLDFKDDNGKMSWTAMNSAEKEKAAFDTPVLVAGNVENWLSQVEKMMKQSVKSICKASAEDYLKNSGGRKQWVQEWQGQMVLAGSQHYWSIEMEEAMLQGGNEGLRKYYEKMLLQLQDLVEIVRSNPSYLIALTLGALMVIDVHARDVTLKMCEDGVSSPKEFSWVSQLRYYWEEQEDLPGLGSPGFIVRQIQASFPYGMEYLGNTPRLVITPLTDRCYITLTGAMDLLLGGAPQGPAGTGKTETTKDLAKALAKQCVVFNCSDGLDYLAMGKFFKGLASSGAWACFDEFNR
eukprot:753088-Hanusia_phi.AAC.3